MAFTTVEQLDLGKLRTLIQTLLAMPDGTVIEEGHAVPAGATLFVTIKRTMSKQTGTSEISFDPVMEQETIQRSMETTVRIQATGSNANQLLDTLSAAFDSSAGMSGMKASRSFVIRQSEVTDASDSADGSLVERAQMAIDISHVHQVKTEQRRIDVIDVVANMKTTTISFNENSQ